jgi:PAS domain S-box-containing protein
VSRLFGVIQDVTEERKFRRSLEKTATQLQRAEQLAHLGSWEWDLRSGVTYYSEEWQRIYGVHRSEIPVDEGLELVHPDDRFRVAEAMEEVATGGGPYHAEFRIIRGDTGEIRHLEGFGQPVRGDDGSVDRVYGATLDVTDRVTAQMALFEGKERLRRTLSATVAALATTTEMRDPYTAGHQQRVAQLSVAVARQLKWDHERCEDVRIAALLHDIGKVVVPAEILTKPGKLSAPEFQLVRAHASAAGEILGRIEWVGPITQAIVQHHERLDGSGYPDGLNGDAIIPEARVLAVADVFEAMVSHRPYRPALPTDEAVGELRTGAAIRYDALAVDACLSLIEDGFGFSAVQR